MRVELSPNGSFNIPEFGTVENPTHFRALRAYSPYHNVRDGVAYPATLFLTGANDPRVDPMHQDLPCLVTWWTVSLHDGETPTSR